MTKIPNAPVLYDTVRDVLNANGGSVTNYWPTAFQASANIDPRAKRKPVRLRATACQDYDPSALNYVPNWWKAYDGNCGFNLSNAVANSWNELVSRYNGGDNGWVYELPVGGDMPLRVGDFGGYESNPRQLLSGFGVPSSIYVDQGASFAISLMSDDDSLGWLDFDSLKVCYFGVLVKMSNGSWYRATSDKTLANNGGTVVFSTAGWTAGNATIYPFISTVPFTQTEGDKSMTLYTMPMVVPQTIPIKQSAVIVIVGISKNKSVGNNRVEWTISVKNEGNSAITLEDNHILISQDINLQQMIGDYSSSIPSATVGAKTTQTISQGVASVGGRDFDFNNSPLFFEVSLGGGQYIERGIVDEGIGGGNGEIK